MLKELISNGKELNYIFSMLTSQFLKFLDVKIMLVSGFDSSEIAKKTKINQYVLKNFVRLSNKYSLNELINIIDGFLNIEHKVKKSSNSDIFYEIENYIVTICLKN